MVMHIAAVLAMLSAIMSTPPGQSPGREAATTPEATRIAVLNLGIPFGDTAAGDPFGGAIGHVVLADDIGGALPALQAAGVEVLIIRINAGMEFGDADRHRTGTAPETEKLVELIVSELNPRFRTVAWIESALDTAAVAAWACEEMYFLPAGNLGAAVLEVGWMQAAKGEELAAWLRLGERASAASGRDPAIMRSMQELVPLSVTRRPDGTAVWSNDLKGETVVNEQGRVLTLNWNEAERLRISSGTAGTREALAQKLGIDNPAWVAEDAAAAVDLAQKSRMPAKPK